MSITRKRDTYSSRCSPVKPGAMKPVVASAKTKSSTEPIPITATPSVRIVRAKRFASSGWAPTEAHEDRDERRRQAGLHEDVEQQLGQDEGRVVGVQLGAGPERPREDAIAHEPHHVAGEDEDGEDRRSPGEETSDQPPEPPGHFAHGAGNVSRNQLIWDRCSASCWRR